MQVKKKATKEEKTQQTRVAIINEERCNPTKCQLDCKMGCPVNTQGKMCIEVTRKSKKAMISEMLCIGCGICVRRCPFKAINIINIPTSLEKEVVHRYGPNMFKLHRLPRLKQGTVVGLVGINGIGKSTALGILRGRTIPNFGDYDNPPEWKDILKKSLDSSLKNYFQQLLENKITACEKTQYVDAMAKATRAQVSKILSAKNENGRLNQIVELLGLENIMDRKLNVLSGGELQRVAIAICLLSNANCLLVDEPTSYLDIKQRLIAAQLIRNTVQGLALTYESSLQPATSVASENGSGPSNTSVASPQTKYCVCIEHDLAVLDYISDTVSILYGYPGSYGVVTLPFSVRDGINVYLDGYIPTENMRMRDERVVFRMAEEAGELDGTGAEQGSGTADNRRAGKHEGKVERGSKKGGKGKEDNQTQAAPLNAKQEHEKELLSANKLYYPSVLVSRGTFKMKVEEGYFRNNEIVVLVGQNGCGKTTFVQLFAGLIKENERELIAENSISHTYEFPSLSISYKPQTITPSFTGTVQELLTIKLKGGHLEPVFNSDILKPLKVDDLFDREVKTLSGGELQRVALCLCLGRLNAKCFLLDEPSAYLDSEQRLLTSKLLKRYIYHRRALSLIVEHDFLMALYMADRVITYIGTPGVETTVCAATSVAEGMNAFLKSINVTIRRDRHNFRPRINKPNSVIDRQQKEAGTYYATKFTDE